MKEQWKQQMQQKMADYKRPAPEVSWDALDKALASNRHKAKTVQMWTRRIAAAVVALVIVTGGYLAFHHEEAPVINKEEAVSSLSAKAAEEPKTFEEPKTTEPQQTNLKPATLLAQNHRPAPAIQERGLSADIPENTPQEQTVQEPQQSPVQEMQASQESQEAHETKTVVATNKRQTLDEPYEIHKQTASGNRLMAKVYLSNALSGDNLRAGTDYYEYYAASPSGDYQGGSGTNVELSGQDSGQEKSNPATSMSDNEPKPPVISTKTGVREESVNHRLPIRFGLSLRYRLDDRWSLESGLAYTRLRSDIKQNDNGVRMNTEQTLSYIGIPVTASYLLSSGRYVNLYVSAGGMVEKMVKGRQHHEYVGKNQERTESVSIRPLQLSVNGALGVEFNLSHLFSIYAEPGMGYYFDNGSSIPTYYQDKPFNFNLNLGLRFNIK